MKQRWTSVGCALVVILLVSAFIGSAASSSTLFGTRFRAGETIQFKVEDSTTWWWGCCSCTGTLVLGWRIVNSSGQTIYSVIHDAPVSASLWQGAWTQIDIGGSAVLGGQYVLYVDTSIGTLSRCFTIYDPCGCYSFCSRCSCRPCACNQAATITNCACRTTLVFIDTCTTGCFARFGWFGCGSCTPAPCNPCTSCP